MSRELHRLIEEGIISDPQTALANQPVYSLANPDLILDQTSANLSKRKISRSGEILNHESSLLIWLQGLAGEHGAARLTIGPGENDKIEKTLLGLRLGERQFLFTQETSWNTSEFTSKIRYGWHRIKVNRYNRRITSDINFYETNSPLPIVLQYTKTRNSELRSQNREYYEYSDPFFGVDGNAAKYNSLLEKSAFDTLKKNLKIDLPLTHAALASEKQKHGAGADYLEYEKNGTKIIYSLNAKRFRAPSERF